MHSGTTAIITPVGKVMCFMQCSWSYAAPWKLGRTRNNLDPQQICTKENTPIVWFDLVLCDTTAKLHPHLFAYFFLKSFSAPELMPRGRIIGDLSHRSFFYFLGQSIPSRVAPQMYSYVSVRYRF